MHFGNGASFSNDKWTQSQIEKKPSQFIALLVFEVLSDVIYINFVMFHFSYLQRLTPEISETRLIVQRQKAICVPNGAQLTRGA